MTDDEKNLGYPPQSPGRYVFKSPLGAGAFANAWAAKDTKTKQDVAIKVLDKMSPGNEPKVLRAEALALQHVAAKLPDHPHIAGLIDIYEDGLSLYIVLQLCTGWQLSKCIATRGFFTEEAAAWVVAQVASALRDLHAAGVIHRDVHPRNILYASNSPGSDVRLIDFGLASCPACPATSEELVGSPDYVAPEVLHYQEYGPPTDMWALGVSVYVMLCGAVPFNNEMQIKMAPLAFYEPLWAVVSPEAKDFVRRLLDKEPRSRLTARGALAHKWLACAEAPTMLAKLTFEEVFAPPVAKVAAAAAGGGGGAGAQRASYDIGSLAAAARAPRRASVDLSSISMMPAVQRAERDVAPAEGLDLTRASDGRLLEATSSAARRARASVGCPAVVPLTATSLSAMKL